MWDLAGKWAVEFQEISSGLDNRDVGPLPPSRVPPPPRQMNANTIPSILDSLREWFETKPLQGETVDPLSEWKTYKDWYGNLAPFVKLIFSIPATSAASERSFSSSGNFATKYRNRISPDLLEFYTVTKSMIKLFKTPADLIERIGNLLSCMVSPEQ